MSAWAVERLDYVQRIWKLRHFVVSMVRCDLNNRYRRSFLGIGWSLLRPLCMTAVFCVVFGRLFNLPWQEYAPFLLLGLTLWQFLVESVVLGCTSFVQGSAYIRQQQVPLAIFPLRTVLGTSCHTLLGLALALGVACWFNGPAILAALPVVLACLLLLFLLGWFLATLCGLLHTHFPDTQHVFEIGIQILFYLTPVLYRPDGFGEVGRLGMMIQYNPLTSVLEMVRRPMLTGEMPTAFSVWVSLGFTAVVGVLAVFCLRKLERTLVFWL